MSLYVNITVAVESPIEGYIMANWVNDVEANFFKKQVLARGGNLLLTPLSTITSVADTVVGIGVGIASLATGGTHQATFEFAMNHLDSSRNIIARPYVHLLRTLNPEAKITSSKKAFITLGGDGFITHYVQERLRVVARSCYIADNFFKRHIASRLTYALLAISLVVTRVIDGIIGVIAVALSFLTLGKVASINNLAFRALQTPRIIGDLFYCTIKVINPWAGTSTSS